MRRAAPTVAAAVLWRKRQMRPADGYAETKRQPGDFHLMMLAITGQWVAEVTMILSLFGAACIGLAIVTGEGSRGAPRTVKQNATERTSAARPDERENF
jgi:hypothetical protein